MEPNFDESPYTAAVDMLAQHNGMLTDKGSVMCMGCGGRIADSTGSWKDAAKALHRHQWRMMGVQVD